MALRFAYNTNGAAHHRLDDALGLIADAGYDGVAITLDHNHIDPFKEDSLQRAEAVRGRLETLGLGSVIETGARFLLDPRAKHEPTLVTADPEGRSRRIAFLERAVDIAAILGSEAVSFWAGVPRAGVDREQAAIWLREGVAAVAAYGVDHEVTISLEPEPGMLVETVADYLALEGRIAGLTLALDVGHCLVTGDIDPAEAVRRHADRIGTLSIEDMAKGDHVHLPFGEGDMDIPSVLDALDDVGFERLVCVELSRDSHRADTMIPQALAYLRSCRTSAP